MSNEENNIVEQPDQVEQPDAAPAVEEPAQVEPQTPEPAQQDDTPAEKVDPVEQAMKDLGIETEDRKPEEKPAGDEPQTQAEQKEQTPEAKPAEAAEDDGKSKSDDDLEAEMVRGIRSERGRDRVRKMLAERKEARTQLQSVQRYIVDAGLDAEGFANLMSIAKLVSSNDPAQRKAGLQALDDVRTELYKQAGIEAPGVDLLTDHADLKQKVADMELTREDALAILRGRQAEARQVEEVRMRQEISAKQQELQSFGTKAMQAFSERANDANFSEKVEAIQKYFSVPGRLEQFVKTHQPAQWESALLWMYDNVHPAAPAAAPARQTATPITTQRARSTGARVPSNLKANAEGISALIDAMGL